MKTLYNIILFGALAMLCSCSGEINNLDNGAGVYDEACRIVAYTETPGSKTSVVDGGTTVYWNVEDEIKVFSGEKSAKFISGNTELATSSDFAGPKGFSFAEGENIVAVYPYSDDVTYDGETITMTLPSEQVACPGTFARGMNISVASSSDSDALQFYNVCGGVRFSVAESGIKKVIFEGLDGEAIAGKVKITFDNSGLPVVQDVISGSEVISLSASEGECFEPGRWYYFVALPGALEKGFKMLFYKEDNLAVYDHSEVIIKRSVFGELTNPDANVHYESLSVMQTQYTDVNRMIENCIVPNDADVSFESLSNAVDEIRSNPICEEFTIDEDYAFLVLTNGVTIEYPFSDESIFDEYSGIETKVTKAAASEHSPDEFNPNAGVVIFNLFSDDKSRDKQNDIVDGTANLFREHGFVVCNCGKSQFSYNNLKTALKNARYVFVNTLGSANGHALAVGSGEDFDAGTVLGFDRNYEEINRKSRIKGIIVVVILDSLCVLFIREALRKYNLRR